jgi:hypothetical protein
MSVTSSTRLPLGRLRPLGRSLGERLLSDTAIGMPYREGFIGLDLLAVLDWRRSHCGSLAAAIKLSMKLKLGEKKNLHVDNI